MSDHESTYKPGSRAEKWIDERLPLPRMMHGQFVDFPTPRNLNYLWTFGGILMFMLGIMILSGIVLSMHYVASDKLAFDAIERIRRDVNYCDLIRNIHMVGASMFFLAVYIHIARGMFYGSYKAPREVLWVLGVIIYLLMMATAFLGYTLPWGQMSFWGATVITNFFSAIPLVGDPIVKWLWGGYAVSGVTLNRFFSLHFLLPFVIAGVVVLHIWALHHVGQNNPAGIEIKTASDTLPMAPYAIMKDLFGLIVFMLIYAWFVFFAPDYLGHADNYNEANPLVTPPHIVPEWYFLPFYAILRAVPSKLGGVVLMFGAVAILAFVPWLDTSRVRSAKYRPLFKWFLWAFFFTVIALGYLGAKPAEGIYVTMSQLFTLYYFAFFLVIMPVLGLIETPRSMPKSITEAVLGKGSAALPAGAAAAPEKR
jgi:ubiquinol-cytochrome c reductase cytochrome b/c1 subunit